MSGTSRVVVALLAAAALCGCTTKKTEVPPLSGPSELATSITLYANPDVLTQDGSSQSQIVIQARDQNGQAIKNLPVRVDMIVDGGVADYGTLAARNLVTGADGRVTTTYTAPQAPMVAVLTTIQIAVTPVGSDYTSATPRTVAIELVPPGLIIPPNSGLVPDFDTSSNPIAGVSVSFDGSKSTSKTGVIVSWDWTFGDGSSGSGMVVQHQYRSVGNYLVTLKITDQRGVYATKSATVTVVAGTGLKAGFVYSPQSPMINQSVFFNAATSEPGAGRTIVSYDWNMGSGSPKSGMTVTKAYDTPGTYNVTLTVTDDLGMKATSSQGVTVTTTSSAIVSKFTYSPTTPTVGTVVNFNGSDSFSAAGITSYAWDFGDGSTGTGVTTTHSYAAGGNFVVRLTVTDAAGQTATSTQTVLVGAVAPVVASFTFTLGAGHTVVFDASGSSSPYGITTYAWTFGDGALGTGATPTHTYSAQNTYTVTLTVTDGNGRTATTTQSVTTN